MSSSGRAGDICLKAGNIWYDLTLNPHNEASTHTGHDKDAHDDKHFVVSARITSSLRKQKQTCNPCLSKLNTHYSPDVTEGVVKMYYSQKIPFVKKFYSLWGFLKVFTELGLL